jgi:hypothetical protein
MGRNKVNRKLFRNELAWVEDLLALEGSSGKTGILYAT